MEPIFEEGYAVKMKSNVTGKTWTERVVGFSGFVTKAQVKNMAKAIVKHHKDRNDIESAVVVRVVIMEVSP